MTKPRMNTMRRKVLQRLGLLGGALVAGRAAAQHTETHFDERAAHRIVYQCNKADPDYLGHVLFSAGELLRKYSDDVEIVVGVFGQGIHLLGKVPQRPVPAELQQRASSLASYGISFHACGNTMSALQWKADDLLPFAEVVPIGVDDIMQLQEQGFAYFSW